MSVINLNFEDNTQALMNVAQKQVPFALALSLTRVAKLAQKHVRQQIADIFTIRKRSRGFLTAIRIKPATKKNLNSQVYTQVNFAALQQVGGVKQSHHGMLAIPAYDDISDVKRRTSKRSPAGVLVNGGFVMHVKKTGQTLIAQRNKAKDLKIVYILKQKAHVPKRLKMIETTQQTVQENFAVLFNTALQDAIK